MLIEFNIFVEVVEIEEDDMICNINYKRVLYELRRKLKYLI